MKVLTVKRVFFVISYYLVNFDGLADLFPSLFFDLWTKGIQLIKVVSELLLRRRQLCQHYHWTPQISEL